LNLDLRWLPGNSTVNQHPTSSLLPIIEHRHVAGCFPEDYKFARQRVQLVRKNQEKGYNHQGSHLFCRPELLRR
jgi:hypothetical protein